MVGQQMRPAIPAFNNSVTRVWLATGSAGAVIMINRYPAALRTGSRLGIEARASGGLAEESTRPMKPVSSLEASGAAGIGAGWMSWPSEIFWASRFVL